MTVLNLEVNSAVAPSISSSAVLVEQNISVWTARKTDKKRTRKVLDEAQASSDAGRWSKNLMAGTSLRKDIFDFGQACRTWHLRETLPWSDKGVRLLPTSRLIAYKQENNLRMDRFHDMVNEFIDKYDQLVLGAAQFLGADYDPQDYPPVEEVARKFAYRTAFSPVPESGDFRLDVANEAMQELQAQYNNVYAERVGSAMQDAWDRLYKAVSHMVDEKLAEPEEGKKRVFHDNLLTNLEDLLDALSHLNITTDASLTAACNDLRAAIRGIDVEDIKSDEYLREDMREQLDNLRKNYW